MENTFVVTAVIVSNIYATMRICRRLTLTASNAKALAMQAGDSAAGFRPLTDYINRYASITTSSSAQINEMACELSRIATEKDKTDRVLNHLSKVYKNAYDSPHLSSMDVARNKIRLRQQALHDAYTQLLQSLNSELDDMSGELRSANIVVTMSRIEALQATSIHQNALNNVADNVENVTESIKELISDAQRLVIELKKQSQ